jgi:hypothetical protein
MKATLNRKRYRRRLRYWLDHSKRQRLLREEMEFHIESMTQDFAAQGMPEEEARFAARRRFGNMTRTSEDARFTWIAHWISDLAQDLRYAFRGMRRNTGLPHLQSLSQVSVSAPAPRYSVWSTRSSCARFPFVIPDAWCG